MSLLTNLVSLFILGLGYVSPVASAELKSVGLFALSGALTNWLAVYMLFERIPFLYGSGVIPLKFEAFKAGIRHMMMEQFFTKENIEKILSQSTDVSGLAKKLDYEKMFLTMTKAIQESSLGGMLQMVGGVQALEPLREPFQKNVEAYICEQFDVGHLGASNGDLYEKIDKIVLQRLEELTPQKVKEIIEEMIKEHLSWLVLWGGVFGGVIGLIAAFIS